MLKHGQFITRSEVQVLCPEAVKAARGMGFRYFWVNDLEFCSGDPGTITQGGRKFSLVASPAAPAQPFIWDGAKWLLVR